jgi:hypothetical protein
MFINSARVILVHPWTLRRHIITTSWPVALGVAFRMSCAVDFLEAASVPPFGIFEGAGRFLRSQNVLHCVTNGTGGSLKNSLK